MSHLFELVSILQALRSKNIKTYMTHIIIAYKSSRLLEENIAGCEIRQLLNKGMVVQEWKTPKDTLYYIN